MRDQRVPRPFCLGSQAVRRLKLPLAASPARKSGSRLQFILVLRAPFLKRLQSHSCIYIPHTNTLLLHLRPECLYLLHLTLNGIQLTVMTAEEQHHLGTSLDCGLHLLLVHIVVNGKDVYYSNGQSSPVLYASPPAQCRKKECLLYILWH